jgi:hypothetical protein
MINCDTCENMKLPHEGIHCYMFKDKPSGTFCGQHTGHPRLTHEEVMEELQDVFLWSEIGNHFEH